MNRYPLITSRRKFLAGAAGTCGAALLGVGPVQSAGLDPRVAPLVSRIIGVDMHSHFFPSTDPRNDRPTLDIDLADEMKRSGLSAICQTFTVDQVETKKPGEYYRSYLQAVGFQEELLKRNHMRRAITMKDLQVAHDRKQPIVIQSVEGAEFIEGKLERLQEAYGRGLRHLQLVHDHDDVVKPLGDVNTAPAHLGGLTAFGADVIRECNRLGMIVDLAHGSSDMVTGALKVAMQPPIISHAGLLSDASQRPVSADTKRRLIPEALARTVADAGGVVGVWHIIFDSMQDYVGAMKRWVGLLGIDHVGIGTDSDITSSYIASYTNKMWPDQKGGFFYAVVDEMLKQGFTADEIGKIGGGNFCRVFAKVTAGRA